MTDRELSDRGLSEFAYRIAHHMWRTGQIPSPVMVEDVAQAGLVAALEAIGRYDETRGASLSTYVGIRIRGAVKDEVHRQMRSHVEASTDEIEPGHSDTPERHALHYERLERLTKAVNRLPARWRWLLTARYEEDKTHRQIAAEMGVGESRISQLHAQIVARLREWAT